MEVVDALDQTWNVERHVLPAAELHVLGVPTPARRTVRWCVPERSALVLGSTQPQEDADADAASALGVQVVRRRSGGGAVLVESEDILWVDIVLPAGDPLWQVDVGKSFLWLGDVWARVLGTLTTLDADVHTGPLITTPWSKKVCFAGLGPGEVTVGGKKLVGISQRRVREGAVFQCSLYRKFDSERITSLLALGDPDREELATALRNTTLASPQLNEALVAVALINELSSL